jgi:nitroreductase
MDFYKVISTRRSIRKYKPIPVEEEKLNRILEAARIAPSAGNRQPWHFIVIKDEEIKNRLKEAKVYYHENRNWEWFYSAPVIICVCGEPSKSWVRKDGRDYRDVDVAITFDHLILAATVEGLGTCWIGAFDPIAAKKVLGIPEGIEPIAFTPLGYPDEAPPPKERKSINEIIRWNKW